jgi:glycosyltransferase involved in cell wall biosynthesis
MRIAFITFEYPPFIIGGAGVYALNITRELAKLGHQVVVFVPDILGVKYETTLANIEFKKIKINEKIPFKALSYWIYLPQEIKRQEINQKFDIIHFNGISYWFLKKKISAAHQVITIHHLVKDVTKSNNETILYRIRNFSEESNFFIECIERRCINSVDRIISVSEFTKNQIVNTYKIDPSKVFTIYNGFDLENFNCSKESLNSGLKEKLETCIGKTQSILFVGRVNDPRKGLSILLKAFKIVLEHIDARLIIVGKGDQTEARSLADSLNIFENLIFTGFVEENELKYYYSLCDIYVCPSTMEGFGLTLLEAMAAEKPIIATNVGAIPEILEDYGLLVNSGNEIELATAIVKTLLENKNANVTRGPTILTKYSWTQAANELTYSYNHMR